MKKIFFEIIMLMILFVPTAFAEEIIIFHTNDMHARIMKGDDKNTIGLAEIAGYVKFIKNQNKNTLWFDAGDTLHGMPRINISDGKNMVGLLNQAGVNIFVPGNHDFNYGSEQLEKISKQLNFPTLSANVVRKNTHERIFPAYKIFQLENISVGVFGLTTPETAYKAAPKKVEAVEFLNPVDTAREIISELRPQCDILICVMHMGVDKSSEFTSERIAQETSGIDLIVDGHSHTELPNGLQVGNTLIVQTGCYEHKLGEVKISADNHKITDIQAKLLTDVDIEKISAPDKKILTSIKKIDKQSEKYFSKVVAHSDKKLSSYRGLIRRNESEIGNLVADAFRWKTSADIAVCNGGSIRTDLPAGDVTRGDILSIFPFGNTLMKAEISGAKIHEMLEHSVFGYPATFGGFLSVSGMEFTFNPDKKVGERVENIFINNQPLDENKIYTIAAPDFLLQGGDDYEMLKNLKVLGEYEATDKILAEYLNKVGMKNISTGRIKNLHEMEIEEVKKAA